MADTIVILDDESDRLAAMLAVLSRHASSFQTVTFQTAPGIINWLKENLSSAVLISLDHDLIPVSSDQPDPGTGRDVADYLATQKPVCPVIIHTTNTLAAPGMEMVLEDAGWKHSRVCPFNDLEWVKTWWIQEVRDQLA